MARERRRCAMSAGPFMTQNIATERASASKRTVNEDRRNVCRTFTTHEKVREYALTTERTRVEATCSAHEHSDHCDDKNENNI